MFIGLNQGLQEWEKRRTRYLPYLEALTKPILPDKRCLRYRIGINLVFGSMNIYEFVRFPDITNNINAVLVISTMSYRHPALRESCLSASAVYDESAIIVAKLQRKFGTTKQILIKSQKKFDFVELKVL